MRPGKNAALAHDIRNAHKIHPAYGHRRMATYLGVNHKRTERVMREFGIVPPRRRRRWHHGCTDSTSDHAYINRIKDIPLTDITPHHLWVSDTSYVKYHGAFWYLVTIMDVATRQILSARVGKHHDAALVFTAVKDAIANTQRVPMYFHTDQGKEFMAQAVTRYLELQGVQISVSDKASPWQNGYKESFFGRFKEEFGDMDRFETTGAFIEEIYGQIHYYNYDRIHTALNMPPAVYAKFLQSLSQKRGT